ncbi:fluoride efflux transporter CrcB [Hyphomicrobium sp.]|uniref:fluoride efflux transporter CrcB n=1 Tax=Hyphomicrobium sp. TaxID=82 RepID=UPI002D799BF0|nr:fluoride efflux transporter CrcB [Hyphomicrobium sp.]HET6390612.1 fluoride efflux transporter CrcB [Hyphomicrobium sp.]
MRLLLIASAGGAIGTGFRFLINRVFAHAGLIEFPWATLTINILGSFLMGVLIETLALRFNASNELRTFFATGILGGFTTFSAFSLEFATLFERGNTAAAFSYVAASVVFSLFAIFAGLTLARWVFA